MAATPTAILKDRTVYVVIDAFDGTIVGVFASEQTARQTADLYFGANVSKQRIQTRVPEYLKGDR